MLNAQTFICLIKKCFEVMQTYNLQIYTYYSTYWFLVNLVAQRFPQWNQIFVQLKSLYEVMDCAQTGKMINY